MLLLKNETFVEVNLFKINNSNIKNVLIAREFAPLKAILALSLIVSASIEIL